MATQTHEVAVEDQKTINNATIVQEVAVEDQKRLNMANQVQEVAVEDQKRINMGNIVVAVDGSQESMRACEWACKHLLAGHNNITPSYNFTLLHVQAPVRVSPGPAYILSSEVFYLLECDELITSRKILKRALDICNHYNVKAKTHVVIGAAKEKICETAQKLGAQFLVMGTHSHGAFIRAIKGSVSDYCSRNAMCPVVVVNKKVLSG